VVLVDVHICHHMDQLSALQSSYLGNQTGQEGVTGYVERNAQSHVATALVEDAVQLATGAHLELTQKMALNNH
jgi:hypothetical protein